MNPDETTNLSGLLIEWPNRFIQRDDLLRIRELSFAHEIDNSKWEEYLFYSEIPFRNEEVLGLTPPFRYPIVARRSGQRILILSISKRIVESLIESKMSSLFYPHWRRVSIAVDSLVKAMVKKPTIYSLTIIHARVPAFGASLRSVSFYGDDLTEASLLSDNVDLMNFFTCGLRYAGGGQELVRIGGDGSVSFYYARPSIVQDVEDALKFLKQEGYLLGEVFQKEIPS